MVTAVVGILFLAMIAAMFFVLNDQPVPMILRSRRRSEDSAVAGKPFVAAKVWKRASAP